MTKDNDETIYIYPEWQPEPAFIRGSLVFPDEGMPRTIGVIMSEEELAEMEREYQELDPEFRDRVENEIENFGQKNTVE